MLILMITTIFVPKVDGKFDTLGLFTTSNCRLAEKYLCENIRANANGLLTDRHAALHLDNREVCFIDFKNSEAFVVEVLMDLQDEVLNVSELCWNTNTSFHYKLENFPILITYMSFDLTRLVSYLLVNEATILLVAMTTEKMYPSPLVLKPGFVYSYESSYDIEQQGKLHELMKSFEISYLAILYLKEFTNEVIEEDCAKNNKTAFCYYTRLDKDKNQRCFEEFSVDPKNKTEMTETLNLILEIPNLRFLLVYGFWSSIWKLHEHPLLHRWFRIESDSPFFIIPFERNTDFSALANKIQVYDSMKELPGGQVIRDILNLVPNLKRKIVKAERKEFSIESLLKGKNIDPYLPLIKILVPTYKIGDPITTDLWLKIHVKYREKIVDTMMSDVDTLNEMLYQWKTMVYPAWKSKEDIEQATYHNPTRVLKNTKPYCNLTKNSCSKGTELKHGFFQKNHSQFQSYG